MRYFQKSFENIFSSLQFCLISNVYLFAVYHERVNIECD